MNWEKIDYPWTGIKIPDSEIESRMKLFDEFVKYFGFDRMARAESVGNYERLLYGKHSYNNVAGSCYYPHGWKEPEDVPDHDHGLLFKKNRTSQIVYVNQPYEFDRMQLEEWCNDRNLIYVICDKKYSFYYPDNTDMVLIMSNDTYINYFDLPHWPQRWQEKNAGMKGIIDLADVPECPAAVMAFYDRYRGKIADIETAAQRNEILSDMEERFRRYVRTEPQIRNQLSEVYQLLKRKCWEVELCDN